ncbi:flagellar protein FlgN [Pacificoceanicola onchidii]|uniref:flagellar protein FlgN n=1 Tax=Pacificoceanicola onchidii TaxID=2562685 RepID=UPI0010A6A7DE|nr:flagellar protein FlgN [Pacificoceanicola onchidii]
MSDNVKLDQLKTLISEERNALMNGDFDRIAELMEEKERLAADLGGLDEDDADVAPIRDGLRRNQELFDHTLAGIRNVANRLGEVNRVRRNLETYDENGRKKNLGSPEIKKLERRA